MGGANGLPGTPKDGTEPPTFPNGLVLTGSVVGAVDVPKVICLPNVGATAVGAATAVAAVVGTPNRLIGDLFSLGLKKDLVLAMAGVDVAPAGTVKVISAAGAGVGTAEGAGCCLLMSTFSNFPDVSVTGFGGQHIFGTLGMRLSMLNDTNRP